MLSPGPDADADTSCGTYGTCGMSWLEEEERILAIREVPYREPIRSIQCYFFYVDLAAAGVAAEADCPSKVNYRYINRVDTENIELAEDGVLRSEKLLHIIQSKKIYTVKTKYVFQDLFLFHVDLEPDEINSFVGSPAEEKRFFRRILGLDDIIIPPSISIFHSVNSLYFFFYENYLPNIRKPRSILVRTLSSSSHISSDAVGAGDGAGGKKKKYTKRWMDRGDAGAGGGGGGTRKIKKMVSWK